MDLFSIPLDLWNLIVGHLDFDMLDFVSLGRVSKRFLSISWALRPPVAISVAKACLEDVLGYLNRFGLKGHVRELRLHDHDAGKYLCHILEYIAQVLFVRISADQLMLPKVHFIRRLLT